MTPRERLTERLTKLKRFRKLGWEILEHKARYYVLSSPSIGDYEYDMLEKEYETLAVELSLPPSASSMVDFDWNRPSCQRVLDKVRGVPYVAPRGTT